MNRWKAVAGILAIFLLGVMTGVTGTGLVVRHRVEALHRQDAPAVKPMVMHRMSRDLDLSEKQKVAVETILNDFQKQLTLLRQTYKPEARRLFDDCFDRIARELDTDQKEALARLREDLPLHFSRHRGPGQKRMNDACPGMSESCPRQLPNRKSQ